MVGAKNQGLDYPIERMALMAAAKDRGYLLDAPMRFGPPGEACADTDLKEAKRRLSPFPGVNI